MNTQLNAYSTFIIQELIRLRPNTTIANKEGCYGFKRSI